MAEYLTSCLQRCSIKQITKTLGASVVQSIGHLPCIRPTQIHSLAHHIVPLIPHAPCGAKQNKTKQESGVMLHKSRRLDWPLLQPEFCIPALTGTGVTTAIFPKPPITLKGSSKMDEHSILTCLPEAQWTNELFLETY